MNDVISDDATIDAFHRGRFHLVQPKGGHRAGVDAMMLAAALPTGFSGIIADLGAGAGAAGLAALSRCDQARASLFELDPVMLEAARATLALTENGELAQRARVHCADVSSRGKARSEVGLADNAFDAVIFNPPFNAGHDRATPDARKAMAHVAKETLFEDWLRTASAIAKPGGMVVLIARPQSLAAILNAIEPRFGALELKPIHAHASTAAIRIVVRGTKGSRAKLKLVAPLVLHEGQPRSGEQPFTPSAESINNGRASLFGD